MGWSRGKWNRTPLLGVVFWDLERRIDAHWGFLEFLWYLIEIY